MVIVAGSMDPYSFSRAPRSPKSKPRPGGLEGLNQTATNDDSRSPTADQVPGFGSVISCPEILRLGRLVKHVK